MDRDLSSEPTLFEGGPLHRWMVGSYEPALHPGIFRQRAIICALFTWLPLPIMALIEGIAWSRSDMVGFFADFSVHLRLLVSLPVLIVSEALVRRRLGPLMHEFISTGLVPADRRADFENLIEEGRALARSVPGEIAVLVLSYAFVILRFSLVFERPTWQMPTNGHISVAGLWMMGVSLPIFIFVALRWVYRMLVWTWFLWRVTKLDMKLIAIHPDKTGGLGFISRAPAAFLTICFAIGVATAANNCFDVLYEGASPGSFKLQIGAYLICLLLINQGPLLVFAGKLYETKMRGIVEYGAFATTYTRAFEEKWLHGESEDLLGSNDIQSLADLAHASDVVEDMKMIPYDRGALYSLLLASAIPQLPLLLMAMPLNEIFKSLSRGLLG